MPQSRIIHDRQAYYSIAGAAKNLGTNAVKVRKLMGSGELDWLNLRPNGRLFIPAFSLQAYKDKVRAQPLSEI